MLHEMADFGIFMLGLFVTIKLFLLFAFLAVMGCIFFGTLFFGLAKKAWEWWRGE